MKDVLLEKIEKIYPILVSNPGVNMNNVFVSIDKTIPKDEYQFQVGPRYIFIRAIDEANLLYGFIDFLKKTQTREILVPGREIIEIEHRGLVINLATSFMSKVELIDLLNQMAYKGYNTLNIEFSDNKGFVFESLKFPQIVSKNHLSQNDLKEVLAYAKSLYIKVNPSFSTPGNMAWIGSYYPEYQLETLEGSLDITKIEPRFFIKEVINEILDLFEDSDDITINATNYGSFDAINNNEALVEFAKEQLSENAKGIDSYVAHINDIASYLIAKNKNVTIESDCLYLEDVKYKAGIDPRVTIVFNEKIKGDLKRIVNYGHDYVETFAINISDFESADFMKLVKIYEHPLQSDILSNENKRAGIVFRIINL